jgi:DNA-binding MarR family transcriptional regulator
LKYHKSRGIDGNTIELLTSVPVSDIFPLRKYFASEMLEIMGYNLESQDKASHLASFLKYLNEISAKLTAPPDEEIEYIRKQLGKALSREVPAFSGTPGTFYNLSSTLYHNSNLTMGELSQALVVPLSTATRMLDWWVDNEFAQRLNDPEDRRVVRVSLTNTGKRLHELIEKSLSESVQQCLNCLTPEEQTVLLTLIRKVALGLK